jgi:hypothetical protein
MSKSVASTIPPRPHNAIIYNEETRFRQEAKTVSYWKFRGMDSLFSYSGYQISEMTRFPPILLS